MHIDIIWQGRVKFRVAMNSSLSTFVLESGLVYRFTVSVYGEISQPKVGFDLIGRIYSRQSEVTLIGKNSSIAIVLRLSIEDEKFIFDYKVSVLD